MLQLLELISYCFSVSALAEQIADGVAGGRPEDLEFQTRQEPGLTRLCKSQVKISSYLSLRL